MRTLRGSHFSFVFGRVLSMPRSHVFEGIENFRDLGGYACDYGVTDFGVIFRSATLIGASQKDLDHMAEIGIKTVIDLRGKEHQSKLRSPCLDDSRFKVVELEVNGNGRISKDYEDYLDSYMEMVEDPFSARTILRAILNAEKPLVFHCNAGKDRTGVFTFLLLALAGVSMDDINADYMLSFPYLRKMTDDTRANHPEVPELLLTPDIGFIPEFYRRFFDRYKTLDSYCEAIGLGEDEVIALRNLMGKQEKSCGAVVFKDGKILVEHMAGGHYSIPKGHVEEIDEDDYATARREIKEETGLEIEFLPGFEKDIVYSPHAGCLKKVRFFLAEVKSGELKIQKEEVQDIYFLTPEDAMYVLTHDSDRQVVASASKYYVEHE